MTKRSSSTAKASGSGRHGFTLTEMLVVMVVISILLAIAIGTARVAWRNSEESRIRSNMEKVELALNQYKRDWGYYPQQSPLGEMNFAMQSPDGDAYLQDMSPPYRQSGPGSSTFKYEAPGANNPGKYDLLAPGVDGVQGTDDDISNWERN